MQLNFFDNKDTHLQNIVIFGQKNFIYHPLQPLISKVKGNASSTLRHIKIRRLKISSITTEINIISIIPNIELKTQIIVTLNQHYQAFNHFNALYFIESILSFHFAETHRVYVPKKTIDRLYFLTIGILQVS